MKEYYQISGLGNISGIFILNIKYPAGYAANLKTGTPADTIIIILSGRVNCRIPDGGEFTLDSERITFFPKNQERTSTYLTDTHLLSIHIDSSSVLFSQAMRQIEISAMDTFRRECLANVISSVNPDGTAGKYAVLSGVLGILDCCLSLTGDSGDEISGKYREVSKIKNMMDNNFTSDTNISDYAKHAAMSESTLRRLFTDYTGFTPAQYRIRLRLKYAEMLVTSGECNIGEAAERAGFNSLPYFCRQFKNNYGYQAGSMLKSPRGD